MEEKSYAALLWADAPRSPNTVRAVQPDGGIRHPPARAAARSATHWEKAEPPGTLPLRRQSASFVRKCAACACAAGAKWGVGTIRVLTMRGFLRRGFV